MSLTVHVNHETVVVDHLFGTDQFERWLGMQLLEQVASLNGYMLQASRNHYQPTVTVDDVAIEVEFWLYIETAVVVYFYQPDFDGMGNDQYVFIPICRSGSDYTVGTYIVMIRGDNGDEADIEEFDRLPRSEQLTAVGL